MKRTTASRARPRIDSADRHRLLMRCCAASGAALIAFHGVLHEVAGPLLFPWAPLLMGPLVWHGLGLMVLILGLLIWLGTVDLLRFPVSVAAAFIGAVAIGAVVFMATRGEFHVFSALLALIALTTALCHRLARSGDLNSNIS